MFNQEVNSGLRRKIFVLLLDAQRGQDIRLRSQKRVKGKPRDGVEPKVSVQRLLPSLPGGCAVTLDKWLGLSRPHFLFYEMRLNDKKRHNV